MELNDILNSNKLKHRFVKDRKLPLNLLKNPYFGERLHLYTCLYPSILDDWASYVEMLTDFESEQDYFEFYNSIKDKIIDSVKESDSYAKFNEASIDDFIIPTVHNNLPKTPVYKPNFNGHHFISYDMKEANFAALSHYEMSLGDSIEKKMFGGAETWEQFIHSLTDNEHIAKSKYIRAATLGNCNPKRHILYEKYLMSTFLSEIERIAELDQFELDIHCMVASFVNDEITFNVTDLSSEQIEKLRDIVATAFDNLFSESLINVSEHYFKLVYISPIDGYLLVNTETNSVNAKSVNTFMMPFLCRKLRGEDICENDKVFFHPENSMLCKFIEVPDFDLSYIL